MSKRTSLRLAAVLIPGMTLLTGCSVGPDYVPPTAPETASYKEAGKWKKAEPQDAVSKGNWYVIFKEPKLNELESQAQVSNQNLRAAIARVTESRAAARETEAAFFPTINFDASGSRQRTSPNDGQQVAQVGKGNTQPYTFTSATVVPFDLSYEVDIWGKVRRSFEASSAQAEASLADYENVLLSLKADVATNYFALQTADSLIDVQNRTIQAYKENLDLTNSRFTGGISTQLDVEQAKATLAAAQAQLAQFQQDRAKVEHAIAVLVGVPPAAFSLPFHPLKKNPPVVPPGIPSDVLERRPDVAAAERRVAAQNAQIGVAIAAYFPQVNLTGNTGLDSGDLGLLFNWQSRIWSYGPNIQFPLFVGGQISANVKRQRAAYEQNVAEYRQSVLVAFQDVEDSLSALRFLSSQAEAEGRAFEAYNKALELTNQRYTTGLVSYFDVIQAEGLALGAEQLTVQIQGNRMANTVLLIKALGGGWADSYVGKRNEAKNVDQPNAAPTVLKPKAPTKTGN